MSETRIALVTGANRGIGFEVARQLSQSGCIVWLGARNSERGISAALALQKTNADVRFIPLDVTKDESVASSVRQIESESGRLDILINNAGIAIDSGLAPSKVTLDAVVATFEVNVLGCIRITQAFLPLLRRSRAARIVMVSSDIGSHANQTNPAFPYVDLNPLAYITSKAALNAVTIAFAKELRDTNIKVNAANPGFTATELNEHRGTNSVEEGARPIVELSMLPNNGPTGEFHGPSGKEPW